MSGLINSAGSKSGVIGKTELDYEEGTWTVGVAGCSITGTTTGNYTKVGNEVTINFYISNQTVSSSSGYAYVNNFPFTAKGPHAGSSAHNNAISCDNAMVSGTSGMFTPTGTTGTTGIWINGSNKYMAFSATYITNT